MGSNCIVRIAKSRIERGKEVCMLRQLECGKPGQGDYLFGMQ